jgi:hypothetical protein
MYVIEKKYYFFVILFALNFSFSRIVHGKQGDLVGRIFVHLLVDCNFCCKLQK